MKDIYFENIPADILPYVFEYYMIGLRHRMNLRKMKELIEFTQGEPYMILKKCYSDRDVALVRFYTSVSYAQAVRALNENECNVVNTIMDLTLQAELTIHAELQSVLLTLL